MIDLASYYSYLPRLPAYHPAAALASPRIVINGAPLRNIAPCGVVPRRPGQQGRKSLARGPVGRLHQVSARGLRVGRKAERHQRADAQHRAADDAGGNRRSGPILCRATHSVGLEALAVGERRPLSGAELRGDLEASSARSIAEARRPSGWRGREFPATPNTPCATRNRLSGVLKNATPTLSRNFVRLRNRSQESPAPMPRASRKPVPPLKRMANYRQRMRAAGLRPVQIWVPDTSAPGFSKPADGRLARSPRAIRGRRDHALRRQRL